ncbi:ankyrin repeat-containing domain protein [Nemania serpens]|nr:ankyrin repeat-containing domain protein [Nemania serpens]
MDMLLREQSRLQQMKATTLLDLSRLGTKSDELRGMRDAFLGKAEALHHRLQEESPESDVPERAPEDWTVEAAEEMILSKEAIGYSEKKKDEWWWEPFTKVTGPTEKYLCAAALVGYQPPFRQLARRNIDVNTVSLGNSPLIAIAAERGSKAIVRNLLALGACASSTENIVSPLHTACIGGHVGIVNMLLCHDSGATKDLKWQEDSGGWFVPIGVAAIYGHTAIVELLLRFGADIEAAHGNLNTLMWAARYGHANVVELLLQFGADVKPVYGDLNALMWAAKYGYVPIVELLFKFGADVEAFQGDSNALMWAARRGHEAAVRLLLSFGANHQKTDASGNTARYLAVKACFLGVVEIFDELSKGTRDRSLVLL